MKAYVIKRDDGCYWSESAEFVSNELWQAELFNDYETALCYCPTYCRVIAIEIKEIQEQDNED